jgi:hypothetical protein
MDPQIVTLDHAIADVEAMNRLHRAARVARDNLQTSARAALSHLV